MAVPNAYIAAGPAVCKETFLIDVRMARFVDHGFSWRVGGASISMGETVDEHAQALWLDIA